MLDVKTIGNRVKVPLKRPCECSCTTSGHSVVVT